MTTKRIKSRLAFFLMGGLLFVFGCATGQNNGKKTASDDGSQNKLITKSASNQEQGKSPTETKIEKTDLPKEKVAFYKKAFPQATSFKTESIPEDFIPKEDKGNNSYHIVYDSSDQVIGYLRDFNGPVSSDEGCACNPLSLTMVFTPAYELKDIISVAPLQKYGHESLTDEEHKQMVAIAKQPSRELLLLEYPQDMVDGTTGATSDAYADKVVAKAGYSSWKIAKLSFQTGRILQGMPMVRDQKRLESLIAGVEDPKQIMEKVIEFIPTAESNYLKKQAVEILAQLYGQVGEQSDKVENLLLNSGLAPNDEAQILLSSCFQYVASQTFPEFR